MKAFKCDRCGQFKDGYPSQTHHFTYEGKAYSITLEEVKDNRVSVKPELCLACFLNIISAGVDLIYRHWRQND